MCFSKKDEKNVSRQFLAAFLALFAQNIDERNPKKFLCPMFSRFSTSN